MRCLILIRYRVTWILIVTYTRSAAGENGNDRDSGEKIPVFIPDASIDS